MKRAFIILALVMALSMPTALFLTAAGSEPHGKESKYPNLIVNLSAGLVNAVVGRSVNETEPVNDVILEVPVSGTSRTTGTVWAELMPDRCRAALDIVLGGRVDAQTVATRPHVLIYSSTKTPFEVRRRIVIDANGIRAFAGPAHAEAAARLLEITNRRGETETAATEVARMGLLDTKADAEGESARKTAQRIAKRLAEDMTPSLTTASEAVGRGLRGIKKAGWSLESLDFHSTPAAVEARLRFGTRGHDQATLPAPLLADTDLGLRIHQSLINEAARRALGGKAFSLTDVNQFYEEATLGLLRDARKEGIIKRSLLELERLLKALPGKPATITLDQRDPLTVTFADEGFRVDINVASIRQDASTYEGMRVTASYRLDNTGTAAEAVRTSPVQFLPPAQPALPGKKVEPQPVSFVLFRTVLFAEILKAQISLAPTPMPDAISTARLLSPRVVARDGWLGLSWKLAKNGG